MKREDLLAHIRIRRTPMEEPKDPNTVTCGWCNCPGNCECGHGQLDPKEGCSLDEFEYCPCCNQVEHFTKRDQEVLEIELEIEQGQEFFNGILQ